MSDGSRQQKRKQQRELGKLGRQVLAEGLAPHPKRPSIIAVAEVLRAKLTERGNEHRAGEAAALTHKLMETSLGVYKPQVEIACRKGCSYCCSTYVMAVAPDVFRLATVIRAGRIGTPASAMVTERAAPLRGLGPDERTGAKLACPLLVDGACSVYAERPTVCRQATSLSLPSCIEEYEGIDRDGHVQVSSAHLAHASNATVILLGAMRAVGLETHGYELSEALVVALGGADTEQRWLDHEDVFKGVARHPRAPEIDRVAAQIAADLSA